MALFVSLHLASLLEVVAALNRKMTPIYQCVGIGDCKERLAVTYCKTVMLMDSSTAVDRWNFLSLVICMTGCGVSFGCVNICHVPTLNFYLCLLQTLNSQSHEVHKTLHFVPLAPACVVSKPNPLFRV